jgi:hypothetical protein
MKNFKIIFSFITCMLCIVLFAAAANLPVLPTLVVGTITGYIVAEHGPKNVLMFNWAALTWSDGQKNMGGLQCIGYYAPVDDITTFPALPASPTTAAEEVTLAGTWVFKTGKCFLEMYSTVETSEVVDEIQGEPDGQSFVHKATIFYPGTSSSALAFAAAVNNSKMVFIFLEASGSNRRVIGSKEFPAKVKCNITTGKATADRKGITMEITSYGYTPAPLFTGTIPITPAA